MHLHPGTLVNMPKDMQPRPNPIDGVKQIPATGEFTLQIAVQDAKWRTVRDQHIGVSRDLGPAGGRFRAARLVECPVKEARSIR